MPEPDPIAALAEARKDLRDALFVVMVLVRRLGGAVKIADADLAAEDGVLHRIPVSDGFELGLAERKPGAPPGPSLEVWEWGRV